MYLMTECDDRMGKYLPLRTSCASVIFYRHGPREKYCTFLTRLNNLAKSYLTIRPLFFSLFLYSFLSLCMPRVVWCLRHCVQRFFFYCQVFYKGAHMSCDNTDCYKLFGHRAAFFKLTQGSISMNN